MKALPLVMLLLTGCAANSGVVPMGQGVYTVSRQAATGFSGSGTLKADAAREADAYCKSQGKSLEVIEVKEAPPPYILGNFPKADVSFKCV